jgi:spore coat polysaccharide biosynthesis predicted glycosyltransferase SpsG
MRDLEVINVLNKKGVEILKLTKQNRDRIYEEVLNKVIMKW